MADVAAEKAWAERMSAKAPKYADEWTLPTCPECGHWAHDGHFWQACAQRNCSCGHLPCSVCGMTTAVWIPEGCFVPTEDGGIDVCPICGNRERFFLLA